MRGQAELRGEAANGEGREATRCLHGPRRILALKSCSPVTFASCCAGRPSLPSMELGWSEAPSVPRAALAAQPYSPEG